MTSGKQKGTQGQKNNQGNKGPKCLLKFPKSARLLKRQDFDRLKKPDKRLVTKHFIIAMKTGVKNEPVDGPDSLNEPNNRQFEHISNHDRPHNRLGIIASRKVGSAVKRNRVKRLIREFFRTQQHRLPKGLDILIIARPGSHKLSFQETADELAGALCAPLPGEKDLLDQP